MPTLPSRTMNQRFVPTYPVGLSAGTAIAIDTANGRKTFRIDYASVADTPGIADPATAQVLVYRQDDEVYEIARLDQLVFPAAGQRTGRGDADYTILNTDRVVALTATLTAPRTWTLPAAVNVAGGTAVDIIDEAGGIGSTNTLTIARSASDTINGASTAVLTVARTGMRLISDGISKWTISLSLITMEQIAAKAVTLGKMEDMAEATIMLRAAGAGTGAPIHGTAAQAKAIVGAASDTATGVIEIATAAEMETGTSTSLAVVPGRLVNHPLVPKVLASVTNNGTAALAYGYGVSSVSRSSAGFVTVNFSVAFSNTTYVASPSIEGSAQRSAGITTKAVGSCVVACRDTGSLSDTDSNFNLIIYGDQ